MLKKIIKLFGITLATAMFFIAVPFTTHAYNASVTTVNATSVTPLNVTFNGIVNTGGLPGAAWFEYGTDLNFANSTANNDIVFNSGYDGNYSTNVSGLSSSTTYYFRAVAQNSEGRVYGNVMSFATGLDPTGYNNQMSPTAITTSFSVLTDTAAQFNSLILPGNSNSANTWFEWGTTTQLGNQTSTVALSGAPAIRHTSTITGLAGGTTYYFRAVTQNSYGVSDGTILSFTTTGNPPVNYTYVGGTTSTTPTTPTTPTTITSTDTTTPVTTNTSSLSSMLGANVFGAGSFLPVNIFGWLILIIFILLLILLSKHVYNQWKAPTH
ncbi:MAG: hypothetical protein P4L63_02520 [Candidatus Pacebacteria bacterium]|nr:hypothetical protein [Candidatus Paceibacterota bacterium]